LSVSTSTSVIELLRELVALPSVSGDEGAVADFVTALLGEAGIETQRLGHTVVARLARGKGPRFLMLSHLDTVPVGEGWTREPYRARWEDGRLYGRGANDAKASAAAMLVTLLELARKPEELAGEVWLSLNAQEETDNAGMRALLLYLTKDCCGANPAICNFNTEISDEPSACSPACA